MPINLYTFLIFLNFCKENLRGTFHTHFKTIDRAIELLLTHNWHKTTKKSTFPMNGIIAHEKN